MMMLEIVLCLLTISGLGASFEIEISRAQVAIKNGTFSPARTVLDCNSASQKHLYCCWIAPQMKECTCDEKDCPLDGVSVTSDQRKCSLTIEHQDASANSGQWTCQLYNFAPEFKIANASTELFIINVNEVSYYLFEFKILLKNANAKGHSITNWTRRGGSVVQKMLTFVHVQGKMCHL